MVEILIARIVLAVTLGGSGILLLWLARATVSGRLGRNQIAGIRTGASLASDEAWLAAHRRAERPTRAAGIAAIAFAMCVFLPVAIEIVVLIIVLGLLVMLGLVLYGAKVGSDAARELEAPR